MDALICLLNIASIICVIVGTWKMALASVPAMTLIYQKKENKVKFRIREFLAFLIGKYNPIAEGNYTVGLTGSKFSNALRWVLWAALFQLASLIIQGVILFNNA